MELLRYVLTRDLIRFVASLCTFAAPAMTIEQRLYQDLDIIFAIAWLTAQLTVWVRPTGGRGDLQVVNFYLLPVSDEEDDNDSYLYLMPLNWASKAERTRTKIKTKPKAKSYKYFLN